MHSRSKNGGLSLNRNDAVMSLANASKRSIAEASTRGAFSEYEPRLSEHPEIILAGTSPSAFAGTRSFTGSKWKENFFEGYRAVQ